MDGHERTGGVTTLERGTEQVSRGVRIDVEGLTRRVRTRGRADVTLLDAVSFSVLPGELVAIVGPSGAGKTTVLEAIAGIAQPTVGNGRLRRRRPAPQPTGVPQRARLRAAGRHHPRRAAARAHASLRRATAAPVVDQRGGDRPAVRDALDAVGLTDAADVRVGCAQRRSAQACQHRSRAHHRPRIFFLDEPTSGLDPITSAELVARLRASPTARATVVFTTHSVADLESCDRIVFMTRADGSASSARCRKRSSGSTWLGAAALLPARGDRPRRRADAVPFATAAQPGRGQ